MDLLTLKQYVVPSSDVAAYPSTVAPSGAVVIAMRRASASGTYLELVKNDGRYWVSALESGFADAAISEKRDFAPVAIGLPRPARVDPTAPVRRTGLRSRPLEDRSRDDVL